MAVIRGLGGDGEVSGIAADLSTAEDLDGLVRQLPDVDILVNNVGIFEAAGQIATAEEVAHIFVYVCSPLASATNGAALRVDGGVVRAIV